uniref:Fatty acid hydroxylase domain-containing protein n=2 Tax=Paramoeba aestuarina TaxID=180227 RepID=A0A7S4PPW2_9EUKA|mmetsp:Transcript_9945/g.15048  ORF Transcript_9945/g.15048 Transcript_9945/m.15048 type:complete len:271 (+) Transcript_9945:130-942(+)
MLLEVWEELKQVVVEEHGYSERFLCVAVLFTSFVIVDWGLQIALGIIYHFDLFAKYKIQGPDKWPPTPLVIKAFVSHAVGQVLFPLLMYYLVWPMYEKYGAIRTSGDLDSWPVFLGKSVVFFLYLDFMFYWEHRLAHHPALYKYVHKQHHEFKQTIGIAFEYAHPVEDLLINTLPMLAFPCFGFDFHIMQLSLFYVIRLWETIDAHCGYEFPFSPWCIFPSIQGGADKHDFHHSHNVGNFGIFNIWDPLMGTNKAYLKYLEKKKLQKKVE